MRAAAVALIGMTSLAFAAAAQTPLTTRQVACIRTLTESHGTDTVVDAKLSNVFGFGYAKHEVRTLVWNTDDSNQHVWYNERELYILATAHQPRHLYTEYFVLNQQFVLTLALDYSDSTGT